MDKARIIGHVVGGGMVGDLLEGADLQDCARVYQVLQEELEKVVEVKSALQSAYDFVRLNKIPGVMDELGAKSVNLDGIGRVTLTSDAYVSVPADQRLAFHEWLVEKGFSDLIQETVNSSTLKAWAVRRVKAGEELPELIKFTPYSRASITKA